jgi:hypothetical protein
MIAESAVTIRHAMESVIGRGVREMVYDCDSLGLRKTLFASARSTITTWFWSLTFSRLVLMIADVV